MNYLTYLAKIVGFIAITVAVPVVLVTVVAVIIGMFTSTVGTFSEGYYNTVTCFVPWLLAIMGTFIAAVMYLNENCD